MSRWRTKTLRVPEASAINIWLMETLPNKYAMKNRVNPQVKVYDSDFWVFSDSSRPTNRMTDRNKHHLYRVEVKTRSKEKLDEGQRTIDRDINIVARTHWPAVRTAQGTFAPGHERNKPRIVRDPDDPSILIQCYGSHLWVLERDTPDNSNWMTWNGRLVDVDTIIGLFNFERHPDNPSAPFEAEMMHKPRLKTPTLFDIGTHDLDEFQG